MPLRPWKAPSAPVSIVGQGTWQMESDRRQDAVTALRAGLDVGMNHIDTAELYGHGEVERIVGEAIHGRRDEVFLVSKVLPSHADRRGTMEACEQSLKRLGTDRLDVYLLHWPCDALEETLAAFEELIEKGKILAYGVSNFDVDQLSRAVRIAGPGRIVCNQVLYHLEERTIEHELLPWCNAHEVAVVGYSPFGASASSTFQGERGRSLETLARPLGMSARQLALRYLTRHQTVWAIPKSSDAGHARENAQAAGASLPDAVCAEIERLFPLGPRRRGIATL